MPLGGWLTVLSLLWLLYWSWCWGWWGRTNLGLQYFLQCACPSLSEHARFPEQAQVVVSACVDDTSKQSQLSNLLRSGFVGSYYVFDDWLLERRTNSQSNESVYYLVNAISKQELPVQRRVPLRDFEIDQDTLTSLKTAQKIFLVQESQVAVALANDFESTQQGNIVLEGSSSIQGEISTILRLNNIPYELSSSRGRVSLNRSFTYIFGIYLTSNLQRIVDGFEIASRFLPRGWASDDRGVVLEGNNSLYLYGGGFQVVVPTGPIVPQPILLLRVPSESLPPFVRQEVEAQLSQERVIRAAGNFSVFLSLGLALFFAGLTILQRRGSFSR